MAMASVVGETLGKSSMKNENGTGRKGRKSNKKTIDDSLCEFSQHSAFHNHQSIVIQKEKLPESRLTFPKNPKQEKYVEWLKKDSCRILLATGPAGTGKTIFSCEYGLWGLLKGYYQKLIFTRPLVSVDEEFGFLPGTMEEKMAPWIRPIYDVLNQFLSQKELDNMMEEKIIEIIPLGFMRGRTFKNAWIVADEMQNSTPSQAKMLLTRIGQGSKMIITGDLEQCDSNYCNGLYDFLEKLYRQPLQDSIVHLSFDKKDIQRDPVVAKILQIYDSYIAP